MLASDADGRALDALKFSLASDIVELVVLSADEVFLQTLREAVGGARRLWHVPSADKVSDLLVAGEVGIVVIDVQALHEGARVFVQHIKRQFPDLVLVAAGHRDDETGLAGLISAGLVYRFIHKPMSPARAKLFAEAAIRKYETQRRRAAEMPVRQTASGGGRAWLVGGIIAALAVVAASAGIAYRSGGEDTGATAGSEAAKPVAADTPLGANPGPAEVNERLLARAENALLEERLDEAAAAIEAARKSGVEGARIAFLTAQLAKSRERVKAAHTLFQVQHQVRARALTKSADTAISTASPTADPAANPATNPTADPTASPATAVGDKVAPPDVATGETASVGFTSAEMSSVQRDVDTAIAKQNFMTTLVPQSELTVQKTVQPAYPGRAESSKTEGWVDVEFTVAETGKVIDVNVRAASIQGVFEDAAVKAVSQWRYKPVTRDGKTVPVRTQIRVRFSLP